MNRSATLVGALPIDQQLDRRGRAARLRSHLMQGLILIGGLAAALPWVGSVITGIIPNAQNLADHKPTPRQGPVDRLGHATLVETRRAIDATDHLRDVIQTSLQKVLQTKSFGDSPKDARDDASVILWWVAHTLPGAAAGKLAWRQHERGVRARKDLHRRHVDVQGSESENYPSTRDDQAYLLLDNLGDGTAKDLQIKASLNTRWQSGNRTTERQFDVQVTVGDVPSGTHCKLILDIPTNGDEFAQKLGGNTADSRTTRALDALDIPSGGTLQEVSVEVLRYDFTQQGVPIGVDVKHEDLYSAGAVHSLHAQPAPDLDFDF